MVDIKSVVRLHLKHFKGDGTNLFESSIFTIFYLKVLYLQHNGNTPFQLFYLHLKYIFHLYLKYKISMKKERYGKGKKRMKKGGKIPITLELSI